MHTYFMAQAIAEARKGLGRTHTNPLVGAVIVQDGDIIAKGGHLEFGKEHAEKNALLSCKTPEKLFNSTLYVTLEPCNHFGKQPPCSQAIIEAGIKQVVIAQLDPNPLVAGQGVAYLENHGVEVTYGCLEEQARALNPFYNHYFEHKRPYITLKQAISLDGKIALQNERTAITHEEALDRVHLERASYQAILIGSQTALTDNPSLLTSGASLYPPVRVVLDRRGRLLEHPDLKLFENSSAPLWLLTDQELENLPQHVRLLKPASFEICDIVACLYQEGIQSLYVEGGAEVHDSFLAADLWDDVITYLSPKLLGGNSRAAFSSQRLGHQVTELSDFEIEQLGSDLRLYTRRSERCLQD
ncbi:bifunctional diaminohydroxyphosphoribosylaminopyrimidine deaminase/5-amino-6-(5-phosphoribosylamino)uracil reductase RibD [Streptococcus loxodontisalivarius]|uniref:Riboflavin biosynthesis protein RibD n=1 Tax=Streptococcus loxodontisalivarius TaxID=1349415 RepID=A0ABS2PSM5_9STRE|nr:bifunctional diaminohydroxyphosphoribosylaminopyrimidine deaminase/5-amino-6-(5-phosphoribosylamino)uracil reductase RibD [Streptococcus loxodontisalivarius]MBM7643047.1 diaminohydroxyphosphoribosylaminopyrimidine deaminase/5-amino-6-(5-phosphoribosylamino)uracil reductase [Streptococcus loxodontisalivarius]